MNPILKNFPDHFETERLLIRSPHPGDGTALYEAVTESLAELKPWMPWAHSEVTIELEETLARRAHVNFLARTDLMLLLWDKTSQQLVGGSGLHRFEWDVPTFEIGYWVRTSCAGHGYITEAVSGISNFAFEQLFAERVEIRMDDRNERSWRVAERCRFKLEGTLRSQARDVNNALRNTRVYSKIRAEWLEENHRDH